MMVLPHDGAGRATLQRMAWQVVALIDQGQWAAATKLRENLVSMIQNTSGVASLLDVRRQQGYDPSNAVDAFLNRQDVRPWPAFRMVDS
jgi:hypothetical protein